MKSTGVLRKLDELGRVTIPQSMKKQLALAAGDMLEVFMLPDGVAYKKYLPLKGNVLLEKCCAELYNLTRNPCFVATEDGIVVSTSDADTQLYTSNRDVIAGVLNSKCAYNDISADKSGHLTIMPIFSRGRAAGALVVLQGRKEDPALAKVLEYTAAVIGASLSENFDDDDVQPKSRAKAKGAKGEK